ncbi:unnamed protein product [Calypogeia fissa]
MKIRSIKNLANAHHNSIWVATWASATAERGVLLIMGSVDETVKVWKGDELEHERTNTGHGLGVVAMAAHPSGNIAASTSLDSFIRVFDVDSNATVATLETSHSEAWLMQFDPKGEFLAVAGGGSGSIKLWNTSTWLLDTSLEIPKGDTPLTKPSDKSGPARFVMAVAWSMDGRRLACSTMSGMVCIFDAQRRKFLHNLEGHAMPVRSLAFSPVDPRILFTVSDDKHIHMYDVESRSLINHSDQVWSVVFRPPGGDGVRVGRLASVSNDRSILLYEYT